MIDSDSDMTWYLTEPYYICECQDCGKEFEIYPQTEEEMQNISCPYCGSGDVLVGDENE